MNVKSSKQARPSKARKPRPSSDGILASAEATFAEHGYGDTSLRQLMAKAGVSTTAFYSRFAGKEVTLVFRSHRRGWVKSDPFSYKGYATLWLEPRILGAPRSVPPGKRIGPAR